MRNLVFLCLLCVSFAALSQRKKQVDTCFVVPTFLSKASNDSLFIQCRCDIADFTFELVDQWNLPAYETSSLSSPLDLDINQKIGKNQENDKFDKGIYYWRITYRRVEQTKMKEVVGILEIQ